MLVHWEARANACGRRRTKLRILDDRCVGCNLFPLVCPVKSCITMRKVESSLHPLTWKEGLAGGKRGLAPRPVHE